MYGRVIGAEAVNLWFRIGPDGMNAQVVEQAPDCPRMAVQSVESGHRKENVRGWWRQGDFEICQTCLSAPANAAQSKGVNLYCRYVLG